MIFAKLILSMIVYLLLANLVFAQKGAEILPDNPLYQAKRQMETAQLNAAFDPLEKATLHLEYAKERLAEVKEMIFKGKPEFVEGLMEDYENSITEAMTNIEHAAKQGRDVTEALKAVERSTKHHIEVLTDLLEKVPEEAKPAIRHSIKVSKIGRNTALDRLRRIQRGELPGGKPAEIGIPRRIGRPEGIGRPAGIRRHSGGRPVGRPGGGRPGW